MTTNILPAAASAKARAKQSPSTLCPFAIF